MPIEPAGIQAIGLDIKLITAQVVNFLIVLLVLRFFAFKPIVAVLMERRKRIADALKHAEQIERDKRDLEEKTVKVLAKARFQASTIINQAKAEAAALRKATDDELKQERERIIEQAKQEIDEQLAQAVMQGRKQLGYLAVKLAERITELKITPTKDDQLIRRLMKEVK